MPGKHSAPEKPKSRKGRKIVAITLVSALLLGGAGVGGYHYLHERTGADVDVFPVNMLGSSDSWYDRVNTGGQVRVDKMQAVYLSSTQTVTEVYVQEGQQVKVGDPILAFDTTLDEVELTRKQIAIDQLNLDLEDAKKELKKIDTYRVGSPGGGYAPAKTPAPTAEPEPTTVPWFQGGQGTAEDPYVFLWDENAPLIDGTVDYLLDMAMGYGVPEVTTGPDVPLDPDAPLDPGQPSEGEALPAEGESAETPALPALRPVSAGQSWTVGGLVSMARPGGLAGPAQLSETEPSGEPVSEPTDTAAPTDTPVPTDTPAPTDTPDPTDTPSPTDAPETEATQTPAPTDAQETASTDKPSPTDAPEPSDPETRPEPRQTEPLPTSLGDAMVAWFRQMGEEDATSLILYCTDMTTEQMQLIADMLTDEQMAQLLQVLKDAGVPEEMRSFPPRSGEATAAPEPTDTPAPAEPTGTPDPSASPEPTPLPVGATYYIVFEMRTNDSMQGDVRWAFEIQFTLQEIEWRRCWGWRVVEPMYEPQVVERPEPEGGGSYFDPGIYYSASEIQQMRNDANQKIRDLTLQLRMAEQEMKKVEYELSNGEVLCTTDGVVKSVLDPTEALASDQPVVMVSGGGGYYVDAYMSEFDMQYLHVGDTVTVENYMAGEEVEGVITQISQYPYTGTDYVDYYTNSANNNASKYPFTVAIDESANLREYYYVNVYFSVGGADEADAPASFYLENAFIRAEGSRSYVYAAGPDGLLEKRYVTTGKSMGGYSTEITSGLDIDTDYIAFPYGRSVKAGAKAVYKEDPSSLWSGY